MLVLLTAKNQRVSGSFLAYLAHRKLTFLSQQNVPRQIGLQAFSPHTPTSGQGYSTPVPFGDSQVPFGETMQVLKAVPSSDPWLKIYAFSRGQIYAIDFL